DHHEAVNGRCYIYHRDVWRVLGFISAPCRGADPGGLKNSKKRKGMSPKFFPDSSRKKRKKKLKIKSMSPLANRVAAGPGPAALALAQSNPYPTYATGPQPNGSWVVSSGQVITPAGTQVDLGIRVRAKAIALNPNLHSHTAAVLTMGTSRNDGN